MLYNDSIYDNLQREYKNLVGNAKDYKVTPKRTNTIKQKIKKVREEVVFSNYVKSWKEELAKFLEDHLFVIDVFYMGFENGFHPFQSHYSTELVNILNDNKEGIKKAHEIKSYYVLSKSLNGFDLNNDDVGWTEYDESLGSEEYIDELTEEDEEYQERLNLLLEAIETVGRAYLENVYSYQGADDTMWDIETRITDLDTTRNAEHVTEIITGQERVLKTSTTNAYEKWNEHKQRIKDKYYQDITFDEYKQKRIMPMVPDDDNKKSLHYLDIFDSYTGDKYNKSIYNFDKDIIVYNDPNDDKDDKINKGQYVSDDCSSFAVAVYWYYLNQIEGANVLNDIDLWYTGSSYFIKESKNPNKPNILDILLKNYFELYMWDTTEDSNKRKVDNKYNIYRRTDFELQPGDLLYRSSGKNGASAHVEFYLGENHSFGWGEIHSTYENKDESKHFKLIRNLDSYNIGKTITANKASDGDIYRIDEKCKPGIYNTIYRKTDNNCRYDYVIRLKKKTNVVVEVENE